jgi:hypothetical protein
MRLTCARACVVSRVILSTVAERLLRMPDHMLEAEEYCRFDLQAQHHSGWSTQVRGRTACVLVA